MIKTKPRFKLLPEGVYDLTVSRQPKMETHSGGYDYYIFDFEAIDRDGFSHDFREFFFPNEPRLREVLLALGGIEDEEGEIQIDETEVLGLTFKGQVKHLTVKGKERARIEKVIKERQRGAGSSNEEEPPF